MEALKQSTTRHQVYLEGLKTGEVNQFAAFLRDIDRDLRKRLTAADLTAFSRGRLEKLLSGVSKSLNGIYRDYYDELAGHLIDLGEYEAGFEARNLNNALGKDFEAVIPAPSVVRAAIFAAPLSVRGPDGGKLLESFIKDWTKLEVSKVTGLIRQATFEGQTNAQIIRTVRGTRANKFKDGLLATTSRNAEAIVRTSVQHVASTARMQTMQANEDLLQGYEWNATLDSRTTTQCRSLDGTVFDFGKGPRPPIHIRCRSTVTAVLKEQYRIVGKGERSSVNGPVPGDLNYYDWLKTQNAQFQNDAIGPTRAKLLRDGGLTAKQFSNLQLDRKFKPLTLAQMRKKEPIAFEKALANQPLTKKAESLRLGTSGQREAMEAWLGPKRYRSIASAAETKERIALAAQLGLTQAEIVAVRSYTGTGYHDINRRAWSLPVSNPKAVDAAADVLASALNKMPSYVGLAYRRTDLPTKVLAQHKIGSVVEYKAFTSTSYGEALDFGPHKLVIRSKTGKRVGWLSEFNEKEREVLFSSPKRFLVADRYTEKDGVLVIELKEL